MTVVDLFAGAGGAALGIRAAMPGADHILVEWDADAAAILRAAKLGHVIEADIHAAIHDLPHEPALLWASPPCQPYSRAGKRQGSADARDCWPITLKAIQSTRPELVVIENVRGSPAEAWALAIRSLGYAVAVWDLDAADFGVAQRRHRRFVVASRVGPVPDAPESTHSGAVLAAAKWGSIPTYWAEHGMDGPPTGASSARWEVAAMRDGGDGLLRWRTVRDVLGLDAIACETNLSGRGIHASNGRRVVGGGYNPPAGRADLRPERDLTDEPSTTIQGPAGNATPHREEWRLDHPSPSVTTTEEKGTRASASSGWTMHGGPDRASDAVWLATGRRRLSPEECAVLQNFPADWPWHAARTKTARYRAVGNACPASLAEAVVRALLRPAVMVRPQIALPWSSP